MSRSLFFGSRATESIIPILESTNSKIVGLTNKNHDSNFNAFSPWMAVPSRMVISPISSTWTPNKRYIDIAELAEIKNILISINQEDDLIPSHEQYQLKVSSLSETEAVHFNAKITEAEKQLCSILPHFRLLIDSLIQKYIPTESTLTTGTDFGMSTLWFKGAVFFEKTQNSDLNQRTENIAHEIAHQIIINYQLNDSLIKGSLNERIYSGIRDEKRPAILSFHGAAALSYMLWVQSTLQDTTRAKAIELQLRSTLEDLKNIEFTTIGQKLYEEFHEALNSIR